MFTNIQLQVYWLIEEVWKQDTIAHLKFILTPTLLQLKPWVSEILNKISILTIKSCDNNTLFCYKN